MPIISFSCVSFWSVKVINQQKCLHIQGDVRHCFSVQTDPSTGRSNAKMGLTLQIKYVAH